MMIFIIINDYSKHLLGCTKNRDKTDIQLLGCPRTNFCSGGEVLRVAPQTVLVDRRFHDIKVARNIAI